ncbi:SRPBCC family protein [Ulvibacter antarcticus]|uniref:Polyketide cyclase/dehydrase/lipid transport protein n=1 Tax=Ulvibacter antarcticus TaxID=442714 RepID=A0A3L9YL92_9FLAO|nr:hypothetical protein [Ulvibacter antarcticus]RMA58915.1 hypothetical protein BXY75_2297 [Ulvibacter antarcticus]
MKSLLYISILYALILVYGLGYLSIVFFGNYGWTLFFLAPFLLGFIPSFIMSNLGVVGLKKSILLGLFTLFIACVGLIVFGIEGFMCIILSLPLFIVSVILGAFSSTRINLKIMNKPGMVLGILALYCVAFFTLDYFNYTDELVPVITSEVIDAPKEVIWDLITHDLEIEKPNKFILRTGMSYPVSISVYGKGKDAVRHFNFSTGSYLQPITVWNEPNLLQYNIDKEPLHMTESNPLWEIHPPHLTGYFVSEKGQISLTTVSNGKTKVEYSTWNKVHMTPVAYWKLLSTAVIHHVHKQFFKSLKESVESKKAENI